MAEYDGSIRIKTKLDNTGFKKDSDELKSAIKSFQNEAQGVNDGLKNAFTGSGVKKSVDDFKSLQKAASDVEKDVKRLGTASKDAIKTGEGIDRFTTAAGNAEDRIGKLVTRIKEFGESKLKTDAYKSIEVEIAKAESALKKLYARQAKMDATGVKHSSRAYKGLAYDIEEAQAHLDKLLDRQERMEADGSAYKLGSSVSGYNDMLTAMQSAQAQVGVMREAVTAAQSMRSSVDQTLADTDTAVDSSTAAVQQATQEMGFFQSAIFGVQHAFSGLKLTPALLGTGAMTAASGAAHVLGSALKIAAGAAKSLAVTLARLSVSGLKSLGRAALQIGENIGKSAVKMISLKRNTSSADQAMGKLLRSVTGIWSMFKRRLVRTFISSILSGTKEGIQNLVQYSSSFNQSISSMIAALIQLKNSFATAFAPILTVVGPVLQTLINYLSTAITYVGMFVASLTGAKSFTRAKAVQVDYAKSLQDTSNSASDASNSVSGVGDAAEEAAEEVEEAAKNIEGFDDVTILEDSRGDDSGKSGSGSKSPSAAAGALDTGMPAVQDMFEDVPIKSAIEDLAKKIKDLIKAQDWEGLGQFLGEKLNKITQAIHDFISWDNLGAKLTEYIDAICRTFNAFVDAVDWDLIGDTVAEGINTLLHCFDLILTGIDWRNLGKSFADGLNGLIDGIDWPLLGKTLGDYLNAWGDLIYGFVHEIKWDEAGRSFSEGLNSLFDTTKFATIGADIQTAMNGILTTIFTAVTTFDWGKAATELTHGLNIALNFDWGLMGATLAETFNGVLEFIGKAVQTFDWETLGHNIMDFITTTLGTIDWGNIGQTISDLFKGALDFLIGAIQGFDWATAGETLFTAVADFVTGIDWAGIVQKAFELIGTAVGGIASFLIGVIGKVWHEFTDWFTEKFKGAGDDGIAGFFKGITDALKDIGKWIVDHVFSPFINGFKKAFGIHSPSTVMAEMGGYLIDGLLNGIKDTWKNVTQFFTEAWEKVTGAVKDAAAKVKEAASDMAGKVKEHLTNMSTAAKEKAAEIKEKLSTAFADAKKAVTEKASEMLTGAKEKFSGMATSAKEKAAEIKERLSTAFQTAKTAVTEKASEMLTSAKDKFSGMATSAKDHLSSMATNAREKASDIKDKLTTGFSNAKDAVARKASEMLSSTKDNLSGMATSAKDKASGIKDSLTTAFNNVKTAVSDKTRAIASDAKKNFGDMATAAKDKSNASNTETTRSFKSMQQSVASAVREILNAVKSNFGNISSQVKTGMDSSSRAISSGGYSMQSEMRDNMYDLRDIVRNTDWHSVGDSICSGIQRGMSSGWWNLRSYAYNMAVSLLDTAKSALGIFSPSHVFRDEVGKMIPLGISEGMEGTADAAYSTIGSIADGLVDAAEDVSPVIPISAESTGIDGALGTFSDIITTSFTRLIDALDRIAGSATFSVPAVATGSVVPYAANKNNATPGTGPADVTGLVKALTAAQSQQTSLTKEDLLDIFTPLFQLYCTTVIGDETIARHAAAGQASIDRRYGQPQGA